MLSKSTNNSVMLPSLFDSHEAIIQLIELWFVLLTIMELSQSCFRVTSNRLQRGTIQKEELFAITSVAVQPHYRFLSANFNRQTATLQDRHQHVCRRQEQQQLSGGRRSSKSNIRMRLAEDALPWGWTRCGGCNGGGRNESREWPFIDATEELNT